jgi:hypothetical protein
MSQRTAGDVGEHLLHHRVVTVLPFGLDQLEGRIGEYGMVAPGGKQLILPVSSFLVQVADPPDDQPGGDGLAFLRRERRVFHLGDLGVGDPGLQLVIPDSARIPDRCPGVLADGGDRGADAAVHGDGDREPGILGADRADHGSVVIGRVHPHYDRPGAAADPGGADSAGGQARRAARGGGVPAAQPGGGDHRRRDRRADDCGQRVQAPDQQRLALDLGVPEPGALLFMAIYAFLHRVDVNEGQGARARQQRRTAGQRDQEFPARLLQLADVAPGIGAQVRTQRGRRPDAAEQRAHRAVPQQVHVIDRIRPGSHPGHQARHLQVRVDPALAAGPDMPGDQIAQPGALRQRHHRDQPGVRHQIRVVEGCVRPGQAMQQSHLTGALSNSATEA